MGIPTFDSDARKMAHDVVDAVFDHIASITTRPVVDWKPPDALRSLVRLGAEDGRSPVELVRLFAEHAVQLHHPSYIGHQVCPPFAPAVIADFVVSALNQSNAVWEMSPIGTPIEKEIVRWLASRAGYGDAAEGTTVSGGSAANLTALLAARARWNSRAGSGRPVILASADAHYSVARAAAIMGIDDVVTIPTDEEHRLDVNALEATLASLAESPLAIVATSGSTATGAFDDLEAIVALRDRYDTWLHVDAAHGASVLLSERLRHLVRGLDRADSFAWDPHKMLWMPLSLGVVLVRDGVWLRRAFAADAPYLFHAERESENIGAMTIQCSKRSDAFKLWFTLRLLGEAPFAEALEKVTATTRYAWERVRAHDAFEALHEPHFNILCFRLRGSDARNAAAREVLMRNGTAWITSTLLKRRRVLRITVINPATGEAEIDGMLDALAAIDAGE
jgi:L-2,4-diaminobutyrate decarboxylase